MEECDCPFCTHHEVRYRSLSIWERVCCAFRYRYAYFIIKRIPGTDCVEMVIGDSREIGEGWLEIEPHGGSNNPPLQDT